MTNPVQNALTQEWVAKVDREMSDSDGAVLRPVMGARVDGNKVVLSVRGGNRAARLLCAEIVARMPKKGQA